MSTTSKVAVIAIHGVADQKPGETAQALAEQLLSQSPNGGRYEAATRSDRILAVPPLLPTRQIDRVDEGLGKRLNQSARSDFLRKDGLATSDHRALAEPLAELTPGAQFSDYLLAKAAQNGASAQAYSAVRIELTRTDGLSRIDVHVWEMYWADLSRLSGSVPRILTELFTLLFRLSSLGRDTVQGAAALFSGSAAWGRLQRLQTWLDWLYSRGLALLFLQLVMIALILVPIGFASDHIPVVHGTVCILGGAGVFLFMAYRWRKFAVGAIVGTALGLILWRWAPPEWVIGLVWLAILTAVHDWWLRVCEERFRMVRPTGWVLWLLVIAATLVTAARHSTLPNLGMWIHGALFALEVVLVLVVAWWGVVGVLLLPLWLLAGFMAPRTVAAVDLPRSFQARASVATGRLGLVVSLGYFLMLSMAGWALVNSGVKVAAQDFDYVPAIFQHTSPPADEESRQECKNPQRADCFLQERFTHSTETFSLITVLLLILVVYLVVVLTPSALAEMGVIKEQFMRLGTWLTGGYRRLDGLVAAIVLLGVFLALATAMLLVWSRMNEASIPEWIRSAIAMVGDESLHLLKPLLIAAASATLAISAAGRLLSRYIPWLRAPLDAALDVDNHFREFPRRAIPRARIFSRYFAVLAHVASQGYDRIVIVSHSQGTVISAEFLRYLKERAAQPRAKAHPDAIAQVWASVSGKISLLTAGCPLRQLYAARFPVMYDWVIQDHGNRMGPVAQDIGVEHWVNVFTTGDYVGRWLWSRGPLAADYALPMVDVSATPGRSVYSPRQLGTVSLSALMDGQAERDISMGTGAHTHYFDRDQPMFARIVDALIVAK